MQHDHQSHHHNHHAQRQLHSFNAAFVGMLYAALWNEDM